MTGNNFHEPFYNGLTTTAHHQGFHDSGVAAAGQHQRPGLRLRAMKLPDLKFNHPYLLTAAANAGPLRHGMLTDPGFQRFPVLHHTTVPVRVARQRAHHLRRVADWRFQTQWSTINRDEHRCAGHAIDGRHRRGRCSISVSHNPFLLGKPRWGFPSAPLARRLPCNLPAYVIHLVTFCAVATPRIINAGITIFTSNTPSICPRQRAGVPCCG